MGSSPTCGRTRQAGNSAQSAAPPDPAVGTRIGGTVASVGGLPLYNEQGIVGGVGISGGSSCADHSLGERTMMAPDGGNV